MTFLAVLTPEAERWADNNILAEAWQKQGNIIAIDHHYIDDILIGMKQDGLETDEDFRLY